MNVFELRDRLVDDYRNYTRSFIKIRDPRIKEFVDGHLGAEGFWPEPLLQLNPAFQPGGTIDDLVAEGVLSDQCSRIFRYRESPEDRRGSQLLLHRHQREAILKAHQSQHYVLTTGTGSGKSLAYIVPIVDRVLKTGSGRGIQAIIVYPMNALANSQHEELAKFIDAAYPQGEAPVRFARYTGQEKGEAREALRASPPDVLLTNYMMLELMLTPARGPRGGQSGTRAPIPGVRRVAYVPRPPGGRCRAADPALPPRVRKRCDLCRNLRHHGQRRHDRGSTPCRSGGVAVTVRVDFTPEQVIGESLQRATPEIDVDAANARAGIRNAVAGNEHPSEDYELFRRHPLTSWIESTFGIGEETETGELRRQAPRRLQGGELGGCPSAAAELAQLTGAEPAQCADILRGWLLKGSRLRKDQSSRFRSLPSASTSS